MKNRSALWWVWLYETCHEKWLELCSLVLLLHCNPNGLENFDHLSTNDSGNDDRSKCTIDVIFSFYMNLKWGWSVIKCDVLLKHNSKQKQESET